MDYCSRTTSYLIDPKRSTKALNSPCFVPYNSKCEITQLAMEAAMSCHERIWVNPSHEKEIHIEWATQPSKELFPDLMLLNSMEQRYVFRSSPYSRHNLVSQVDNLLSKNCSSLMKLTWMNYRSNTISNTRTTQAQESPSWGLNNHGSWIWERIFCSTDRDPMHHEIPLIRTHSSIRSCPV